MKTIKTSLLIIALMAHQTSQAAQPPAQDFEEFWRQARRMGTNVKDFASSLANSQKREHTLKRGLHYLSFVTMNLGNLSNITSCVGLSHLINDYTGFYINWCLYGLRNIYNCFNSQKGVDKLVGGILTTGGIAAGNYHLPLALANFYGLKTDIPTFMKYFSNSKGNDKLINQTPLVGIFASALLGAILRGSWSMNALLPLIPASGIAYLCGLKSFTPLAVQLGISSLTQSSWPYTPWIPGAVAGAIAAYATEPKISEIFEKEVGKISKVSEYEKAVKRIIGESKESFQSLVKKSTPDFIRNARNIIINQDQGAFTLVGQNKSALITKMSDAAQNINSLQGAVNQTVVKTIENIANSLDRHTKDYKVVLNIDPTPDNQRLTNIPNANSIEPRPNKDSEIQVKDVIQYAWKTEGVNLNQNTYYDFEKAMLKAIKPFTETRKNHKNAVDSMLNLLVAEIESLPLDFANTEESHQHSLGKLKPKLDLIDTRGLQGKNDLITALTDHLKTISDKAKNSKLNGKAAAVQKRSHAISVCIETIRRKFKPLEKELESNLQNKTLTVNFNHAMTSASIVDKPLVSLINPLTLLIDRTEIDIKNLQGVRATTEQQNKLYQKINMKNELNNLKKFIENNFGNGALDINI